MFVLLRCCFFMAALLLHLSVRGDMCGPEQMYWNEVSKPGKRSELQDASCFFYLHQYPELPLINVSSLKKAGSMHLSEVLKSKVLKDKTIGFASAGYDLISDMQFCGRLKRVGFKNPKILKFGRASLGEIEIDSYEAAKMVISERSLTVGFKESYPHSSLNSHASFDSLLVNDIYPLQRNNPNKTVILLLPSVTHIPEIVDSNKARDGVFFSVVSPSQFAAQYSELLLTAKKQGSVPNRYRCE
ncbi:hypothetical protein ACFOEK_00180 [Litoribrevibacter euphylliae]|uniref:Uncharacterized protein n=1 Tax=Litoribrevibacter euphylliae TaxID=1834034 RepID=A0ABV7HA69_9GAMM